MTEAARSALDGSEIAVAVLGRFKAGKSTFLNDIIGRKVLPVGATPVTAAITEIRHGMGERASVVMLDGRSIEIPLGEIRNYVAESDNPENIKGVSAISIELPELRQFPGLKFVDTPGLESSLGHNSETSLEWLPNAGLALIAVGVDPPLSKGDLELLKSIYRYTPKAAILLTKADLLGESDLAEVIEFVRAQLARSLKVAPRIFPYSTKPGFERYRDALRAALLSDLLGSAAESRRAIAGRKVRTLLLETGDYLTLALRSAEAVETERRKLEEHAILEREMAEDVKSQFRLLTREAAAGARQHVSARLETHSNEVERGLLREFKTEFPAWTKSLAVMLSSFESWLAAALRRELAALSASERGFFIGPLHKTGRQAFGALEQFRERLSERTLRAFGVPLRTTETAIAVSEPSQPDVRVAKIFDRNWELLSPILPVWAIAPIVRRHFERAIPYLVYQNLSRLSAQWEEGIRKALGEIESSAESRLDELIATLTRLLETGGEGAPQIRADLGRIRDALKMLDEGE